MNQNHDINAKTKKVRNILLLLLGFLAIGALGGGCLLIRSPDGTLLQLTVSEFKNLPFHNFLIPGIILFTTFRLLPILLIRALLKKPKYTLA